MAGKYVRAVHRSRCRPKIRRNTPRNMTQIRQVLPDSEGTVPDQEKEAAAVGGNVTPKWHQTFLPELKPKTPKELKPTQKKGKKRIVLNSSQEKQHQNIKKPRIYAVFKGWSIGGSPTQRAGHASLDRSAGQSSGACGLLSWGLTENPYGFLSQMTA